MKKRGGYPGDLTREVKARVSPELYREINSLSEERQFAIACIVREWILLGLASCRPEISCPDDGGIRAKNIEKKPHL